MQEFKPKIHPKIHKNDFSVLEACPRWSMDQKFEFGSKRLKKKDDLLFPSHFFTNSTTVLSRINMKKYLKARVKQE